MGGQVHTLSNPQSRVDINTGCASKYIGCRAKTHTEFSCPSIYAGHAFKSLPNPHHDIPFILFLLKTVKAWWAVIKLRFWNWLKMSYFIFHQCILKKKSELDMFENKIQFTKLNSGFWDWTKHFCDLQLILRYVCVVTFCSKINLKFLWSENSLQWPVFFAFSLKFLTLTPSSQRHFGQFSNTVYWINLPYKAVDDEKSTFMNCNLMCSIRRDLSNYLLLTHIL